MIKVALGFIIGLVLGMEMKQISAWLKSVFAKKPVVKKMSSATPPRATITPETKDQIVQKYAPEIRKLKQRKAKPEEHKALMAKMNAEIKTAITWKDQ